MKTTYFHTKATITRLLVNKTTRIVSKVNIITTDTNDERYSLHRHVIIQGVTLEQFERIVMKQLSIERMSDRANITVNEVDGTHTIKGRISTDLKEIDFYYIAGSQQLLIDTFFYTRHYE